jgi:glycosyltransferase involved in cell wall biosynthesis
LPTQPFILFVGALADYKGLGVLLAAYQQLVSPPPLVLVGIVMPPYREEAFPPGVVVMHDVPHPTVMVAWEHCLFAVAPSLVPETFGNVITEAMSKGKAVIATDVGGPMDIVVPGVTGLLVPLGDADALAKAMQQLIDDDALRVRLACAARERVKLYATDTIVPRFEELYRQVIVNTYERQQ